MASGAGAMFSVTEMDLVRNGLAESVTVTVKLKAPPVEGVPAMVPVDGERVRPLGRAPEEMDQV